MEPDSRMYKGILRLKRLDFEPSAILDIGASNGAWTRGVRGIYPDAYILMIEALFEKAPLLAATCHDLGNCDYEISLLGERTEGAVQFFVVHAGKDQSGSSKYSENTAFPKEERFIMQRTLDTIIDASPRPYEFAKLDVQGAELDVLRGAEKYLPSVKAILMEVATVEYNQGAPLAADVLYAMKELGFVLYDLVDEHRADGTETLRQFDAIFIRPQLPYRR